MIDSLMPTRWKLKEFLDDYNITVYALAQKTEGKLSRNALYHLASNPKGIQFETLNVLVPILSEMTGQKLSVSDLLDYEDGVK
jgi:DNA-binding Xre family transcriptional regulator